MVGRMQSSHWSAMKLPDGVLGMAGRGPDWARWVERLPGRLASLLEEWELTPDGWSMHGYCSIVVPVRTSDGETAVLKVAFDVDEESEHEHLALRHWGGRGAVRLLRADPHRRAMLLERLHHEDLTAAARPRGVRGGRRALPPAAPARAAPAAHGHVVRRALVGRSRDHAPQRADPAADGGAGPVTGAGPRRRPRQHGRHRARRPALPERARGRPGALARRSTPSRCPATRTSSSRRCSGTAWTSWATPSGQAYDGASTRSSTRPGWTRPGPATGSSSGWCSTPTGRWRTPNGRDRDLSADERDWITSCIAIVKAVQD